MSSLSSPCDRSVAVALGVLAAAVLLSLAVVGSFAALLGGKMAVGAAAAAAASCFAGAAIGLLASRPFSTEPSLAMAGLLVGMVARMGAPLATGTIVHLRHGPLAEAGLLYYLPVFYVVTLAVETALALPARPRRSETPGDAA